MPSALRTKNTPRRKRQRSSIEKEQRRELFASEKRQYCKHNGNSTATGDASDVAPSWPPHDASAPRRTFSAGRALCPVASAFDAVPSRCRPSSSPSSWHATSSGPSGPSWHAAWSPSRASQPAEFQRRISAQFDARLTRLGSVGVVHVAQWLLLWWPSASSPGHAPLRPAAAARHAPSSRNAPHATPLDVSWSLSPRDEYSLPAAGSSHARIGWQCQGNARRIRQDRQGQGHGRTSPGSADVASHALQGSLGPRGPHVRYCVPYHPTERSAWPRLGLQPSRMSPVREAIPILCRVRPPRRQAQFPQASQPWIGQCGCSQSQDGRR